MWLLNLDTVRWAARLAVYDDMMIKEKNHRAPPNIRVERVRGCVSPEHSTKEENVNHMLS